MDGTGDVPMCRWCLGLHADEELSTLAQLDIGVSVNMLQEAALATS